ncbi:hypothetical protein DFH08DRAFT_807065 [Mycena albidolilacea]|uniref:Uncharacterized protein n=1 Tax=Mycena albidolilacea TaxID=1033008 RepID=A0AAD7A534_9AGAR|nr:hypothetical protein DFH08DRAFT_807065 [Mycena albidolilacea]
MSGVRTSLAPLEAAALPASVLWLWPFRGVEWSGVFFGRGCFSVDSPYFFLADVLWPGLAHAMGTEWRLLSLAENEARRRGAHLHFVNRLGRNSAGSPFDSGLGLAALRTVECAESTYFLLTHQIRWNAA